MRGAFHAYEASWKLGRRENLVGVASITSQRRYVDILR